MKILHILNDLRHSGAETMLFCGAHILSPDTRSHVVSVGQTVGPYAPYLEEAGFTVRHFPIAGKAGQMKAFEAYIRAEKFDCLHIHTERRALQFSWLAKRLGIPSVRSIHNEFLFNGVLRARRILTRQTANLLGTRHVACSPRVARNEKRRFHLDCEVVMNWIDVHRLEIGLNLEKYASIRTELGLSKETMALVSIANEAPAKNLRAQFEGVLIARRHGLDVELYHCGAISPELTEFAQNHGQGAIHVLGTVDDIGRYIRASDFYICASHYEGGPISLLEAAVMGINCLTTRVGLVEAFDSFEGVQIISTDAESIAAGIELAAKKPAEKRLADGKEISDYTLSHFVPEVGATAFMKIYESVAQK